MTNISQIYDEVRKKTKNGKEIPTINKNGVKVPKVTVLEDIMLRNMDILDNIAIEINQTKLTYREFYQETEKYMSALKNVGLKEHDVVSLCVPVGIEFICTYFAATTLGITVNAQNIMFVLQDGLKEHLSERCSHTLIIDKNYYQLLKAHNKLNDEKLKHLIITGDEMYAHLESDRDKILIPGEDIKGVDLLTMQEFLKTANPKDVLKAVEYNEDRISTLNYTSGSTGKPKCMAHSDLAPLFLTAAHDGIKRNEQKGDRTLLTIPLNHPTGLFYAMVFQLAQGKTLVLEPRYDKTLFSVDIITKNINHAVQAKPFYAQLVQDQADGKITSGDFSHFKNAYSGGEGIPLKTCRDINETLKYGGCNDALLIGYGRSEEGSSTMIPYNMIGRENTIGIPLPGIQAKIVEAGTLKEMAQEVGAKGEILVSTCVHPMHHSYLGPYNKPLIDDESVVDENGVRWARAKDIATLVELPNKELSYLVHGRSFDTTTKNGKSYYLFDLKEQLSNIEGIQECEVIAIPGEENYITARVVIANDYQNRKEEILKQIQKVSDIIDASKVYEKFGINATSGKCDIPAMRQEFTGFVSYENDDRKEIEFTKENDGKVRKRVLN